MRTAAVVILTLVLAGVGYLIFERRLAGQAPASGGDGRVVAVNERVDDLAAAVEGLRRDLGSLAGSAGSTDRITAIEQELAARKTEIARAQSDLADLEKTLLGAGDVRERLDGIVLRQDEMIEKIGSLAAATAELRGRVETVEGRPPVLLAPADAPGDTGAEPAAAEPDAELLAVLERLSSKDATERWEAVDQIRKRRDKALVPYVLPLLDDRDTFVRAQAVYTLGELRATEAVPKLVKLLRDDELMIREESLTSLVVITGQNYRFDVDGSRDVREKGIKRWEQWLGENKDKL
jgi:HEAT repeat protein